MTGPFNLTVSNTQLFLEKDAAILNRNESRLARLINATSIIIDMYVSSIKSFVFRIFAVANYLDMHTDCDCEPGTFACAYARQAIIMAWNVTNLTLREREPLMVLDRIGGLVRHLSTHTPCSGHKHVRISWTFSFQQYSNVRFEYSKFSRLDVAFQRGLGFARS